MIKQLNKREKILLLAVIIAVSFTALNSFVLKPVLNSWGSLSEKINSRELTLRKYTKIMKQEKPIDREFARYSDYMRTAGSDEELISMTLREIEKIAKNSNITITDIKSQPIQALKGRKELVIDAEIDAATQNLISFIYNLKNSRHVFSIEKMNLAKSQENTMRCYMRISKILIE